MSGHSGEGTRTPGMPADRVSESATQFIGVPQSTTGLCGIGCTQPWLAHEWLAVDRWGAYFRHSNPGAKFSLLDSYVHLRLARLEMVRHGRRGWGWTTHYRLPWLRAIGVHRLWGTVRWGPTHAAQ